jgi:ankyrin repeat protein
VNEAQPDGTRPIHWAVYRADYEVLEAFIAKKAKANVTNELGSTPLAEGVKLTDSRIVKMLLDAGITIRKSLRRSSRKARIQTFMVWARHRSFSQPARIPWRGAVVAAVPLPSTSIPKSST